MRDELLSPYPRLYNRNTNSSGREDDDNEKNFNWPPTVSQNSGDNSLNDELSSEEGLPLDQPEVHKKPNCSYTALRSIGNFLFKCEKPKARMGVGLLFGLTGLGLSSLVLGPLCFLTALVTPLTLPVQLTLLAAGIFLAAVGAALIIHGAYAHKHGKSEVEQYRPIGYNPDVYDIQDYDGEYGASL